MQIGWRGTVTRVIMIGRGGLIYSIAQLKIRYIFARAYPAPPTLTEWYHVHSEQFKKIVTLHLPRAAVIYTVEEASDLKFCSPDSSSGPPYEFEEMNGGSFTLLITY